ncbi:HAD family phosphatase [Roseomonas sp. OT10]|uniref:HAD family hydrolase n=1 Tax=Roseomonas cutis TaxID=2897332 RepID=UPI001E5125AD|nr:HAD family phosphatase [Roseomonas sp. OT10]UFN49359.1 HAD family phosphatase [Roseomonas sp. OT10]
MPLSPMPLPQRPEAVVFDMDGLLFDTETLYRASLFAAAEEMGHPMTDEVHRAMLGCPWPVIQGQLVAHLGSEAAVAAFRTVWTGRFEALLETGLCLKAGVVELLDTLDALGLPRAIATSSRHASVSHHLAAHGLTGRFHAVVAQGDYARSKPAPDPFLAAAARLGLAPERCLALEDSHNGVRSAASAGMMTVMVPDLLEATEEMRGLCRHVAGDLHAVRGMVLASWGHGVD